MRENCTAIVIRLLDGQTGGKPNHLVSLAFAADALRGRNLQHVIFEGCYFQSTSLASTSLVKCIFRRCRFETLEFHPTTSIQQCTLDQYDIRSVARQDNEVRFFDPAAIAHYVKSVGFTLAGTPAPSSVPSAAVDLDERTIVVERALRLFLRNTHVNESAIRVRLGVKAWGSHTGSRSLRAALLCLTLNVHLEEEERRAGRRGKVLLRAPIF